MNGRLPFAAASAAIDTRGAAPAARTATTQPSRVGGSLP